MRLSPSALGEADVEVCGEREFGGGVDARAGDGGYGVDKLLFELCDALCFGRHVGAGFFQCCGQPHGAGHVHGAGANAAFLSPTVDQGMWRRGAFGQEQAHAAGAAEFVAGCRQGCGPELVEVHREFPHHLDRVHVYWGAGGVRPGNHVGRGWMAPVSLFAHMHATTAAGVSRKLSGS